MAASSKVRTPTASSGEVTLVPTDELRFDEQNPRLQAAGRPISQDEILQILWREFAVDEIALSIAANGYFPYETILAARESGALVVVEGNRRLAAVRLLVDPKLRKQVGATDLPHISEAQRKKLHTLPVIEKPRREVWQYVGFKHVNGPQAWRSLSKAQYIAWVHNQLGVPLEDIANRIGDRHYTVSRLYRALMALNQAETSGTYSREERDKKHFSFSHLYTGLDYTGIQRFLGITDGRGSFTKKPVASSKVRELGELCEWLFGSKSKGKKPLVRSQNPDLRVLDEVLQSKNGIAALRKGLPLLVAREAAVGDEQLFRQALLGAKRSLQEARGRLLTGYRGEADLMTTAEQILDLATDMRIEMAERRPAKERKPVRAKRS